MSTENKYKGLAVLVLAKNCEKRLKKNLYKISSLQKYFQNFKIFIFENNSTDGTKTVLKNSAETNPYIKCFTYDLTDKDIRDIASASGIKSGKPCRIQIIAWARNYLLNELKKESSLYSHVLVVDIDAFVLNVLSVEKILKSNISFDCISANGLTKRLQYRDAYAFRSKQFPFGAELEGSFWWNKTVHAIQTRYLRNRLVQVYSAFGGAALYKAEAYLSSEYSALPTPEYISYQKQISQTSEELVFKNSNYDAPIICEHVPFHYKMALNGYNKQYILTSWRLLFLD